MIEITALTKADGPLTKRISLADDGAMQSDGSACVMSSGVGRRLRFSALTNFANHIGNMAPEEAIALGALRSELADTVRLTTKSGLTKANGSAAPDLIARTADFISYRPGEPALALIDFDTKGMPASVRDRIHAAGGIWSALASVIPELAKAGRVLRRSTSSGIIRTDTGAKLAGSDGMHVYVLVADGADVERFLHTLHDRCWLQGLGWMTFGTSGQLLERSIVDRMVYAGERLVFEGAPVLEPPLKQNRESRRAKVGDGGPLDTRATCPPLRLVEQSNLQNLQGAATHSIAPDRARSRERFITEQTKRIVDATGATVHAARRAVERQCDGVLTSTIILPFDDAEFEGSTVADVLGNPNRFIGATLADPLEGPSYGRCKAMVMRRTDGTCWINSFAHGRSVYEMRHTAEAVSAHLATVHDAELVDTCVQHVLTGDLTEGELDRLCTDIGKRAGVGKRVVDKAIKAAQRELHDKHEAEAGNRQVAERLDPRPQIQAPTIDAPWLPQMAVLNDVLGSSSASEPPMRDVRGYVVTVCVRRAPNMHALTSCGANEGETEESRVPAPEHPLLTRLDEVQLGELIEQHIDYVDPASGRSVHLCAPFVKHFLVRADDVLPLAVGVATLPMILHNGTILSGHGLDRERSIISRIPPEVQCLVPDGKDCGPTAVAGAMRFLVDDWLCDVAADYEGKAILIAATATILERLLLPERPAFFISAGQRGGGKTTAANMVAMAALGCRAAAAAWSPNEEERRKSLLAYLTEGVPLICWDNIPRGAAISCPSLEKALTTPIYSDRVLGVSEYRCVPATSVHVFTGNNISARGDMASRALAVRLVVDRLDPENRQFTHGDPIGWTEANRGRILRAIYTILLGNPRLIAEKSDAADTRFKSWWHLVGAAVENAAREHKEHVDALTMDRKRGCIPSAISFKQLFMIGEADDEQTSGLGTVLEVMLKAWPSGAKASQVAAYVGASTECAIELKAALEQASGKAIRIISATVLTWRLKAICDAAVRLEHGVCALQFMPDPGKHGGDFIVRVIHS